MNTKARRLVFSFVIWLGAIALGIALSSLAGKAFGSGRLQWHTFVIVTAAMHAFLITCYFVVGENVIEDLVKSVIFSVPGIALMLRSHSPAPTIALLLAFLLATTANALNKWLWDQPYRS